MAENVGYATLNIIPSAKGFGKNLRGEINPALASAGRDGGNALGNGISKAFTAAKNLVLGSIATIGGSLVGLAVYGGFSRALKLDEARTKLSALNYTTAESEAITQSALASVKGTAFGLDSAVSSAVGLLAAGIKPGTELTGVLTTISNTAALAGTSMDEMGSIFGKIAANGKVTTAEMNMLADRGVPIWQYLAESIGVTAPELRKMIEAGEVTADMFYNGLGPAVEGIATVMGTSFKGMLSNAKASLGRLGALFAGPILESGKGLLGVFTELTDSLGSKLAPVAERFGAVMAGIDWASVIDRVADLAKRGYELVTTFSPGLALFNAIKPILPQLTAALIPLGAAFTDALLALLPSLLPLLEMTASLLAAILPPVTALLTGVIGAATGILQFVAANAEWLSALGVVAGVIAGVIGAITLFKAVQLGLVAATYGVQGAMLVTGTAAKVYGVAMNGLSLVQKAATAAQWLFNAAMNANPIMIVVTAIGALVAGLVYFFTQTELGQAIWAEFTRFLGEAWDNIVAVATAVWEGLSSFFTTTWKAITSVAETIWKAVSSFFSTTMKAISDVFTTVWNAISDFLGAIFKVIGTLISNYIEVWKNVFLVFAAVLKVIWDGIVAVVKFVWDGIVAFLTPLVQGISDYITDVIRGLSIIWNTIWTAISDAAKFVWNALVSFLTPVVRGIANFIADVVRGIQATWTTIWNAIKAVFTTVWNALVAFLTPIVNTVRSVITSAVSTVQSIWNNTWNAISSFFSSIWNGIVNGVTGAVGTLMGVVGGIYGKVMGALSGAVNWLFSAGSDIVRGLWNGIANMGDWLWRQVTGFFDNVTNWAKDVLGIASPSKVFRGLGEFVGEGFADGIDSMAGSVASSAEGLAKAAIDAVDDMPPMALDAHINGTSAIDGAIPPGGLSGVLSGVDAGNSSTSLEYHQHGGQGLTAEQELVKAARRLKHVA